jgi:Mrp family chromosome partitioning ATPase
MHAVEGIDQLAVVTAGTLVMHPQELLAGQAFAALIKTWSSRYQHIVIDTPPASSQSDALSLSSLSGATVLLARQHHTLLLPYQTLLRRLSSANITVLAAVLSAY